MQEEVRLRPAARQFLALPIFAAAVFAAVVALPYNGVPWLLFPLTALLLIPQMYGVKLTENDLIYLRLFGPQRLAWSSITEIECRTWISTAVIVYSPTSTDRLVAPRRPPPTGHHLL